MNTKPIPLTQHPQEHASSHGAEEPCADMLLSALLDGELAEAELGAWLSTGPEIGAAADRCQTYQFIGESLRGQMYGVTDRSASVFLAGVQTRLRSETPVRAPVAAPDLDRRAAEVVHVRAPAANDAVFRWKLVAGLASLTAVMAVSWTVLGSVAGTPGQASAGPQLALSQPAQTVTVPTQTVAAAEPVAARVVVNTPQGVLIRDPELEALMAEHRQHGGVSALQMPAGFLRSATYDPDAR